MLVVETIARIRRAFFVQGKAIKAICRDLGVSRKVVREVIRSGETEFRYHREDQPLPKIGRWRGILDELLRANEAKRETQQYVRIELLGSVRRNGRYPQPQQRDLRPPDIPCRPTESRFAKALPSAAQPTGRLEPSPNIQRSLEDGLATTPPPTAQANVAVPAPCFAWVVQVIGRPTRALATLAWGQLKQKYAAILADRDPTLVETKLLSGMSWYRVRIGPDGLERAKALCAQLQNAGASCLVQRN